MRERKLHSFSVSDTLKALHSHSEGLNHEEVRRRQAEFGFNVIKAVRRLGFIRLLLAQFTHFFAIILWLSAALAFFAEWHRPHEGMF